MPEVNLSTLRDRELRQLLDSARQRGQASLSYMILQEMEARRANGGREKPSGRSARRPAEPRIAAVDLGDPLERAEEFPLEDEWETPTPPQPQQAEPAWTPSAEERPLHLDRPRASDRPPPPPALERKRSRSGWGALLFACGLALGLAGGWKAAEYAYAPRLAKAATADLPAAANALPAPATAPPSTPPPAEAAIPDAPPPPPEAEETPAPAAEAAPETPAPAEPEARPAPPPAEETDEPTTKTAGCAAQPTPADRTICGDPKLQRLQRDLRQAYAEALEAHEDRALLRQRQLAWRDDRDPVSDPDRLARIYEERIRKLKAATAEALKGR